MPHKMTFVRGVLVVLLSGALGCSGDLLLPEPSGDSQIGAMTKVNGDEQTGPVGEMLQRPLAVKVLTQSDQPAEGVEITFQLSDPAGGSVDPTTATTNSVGEAVAHWTLGTVPGPFVVTARLGGGEQDTVEQDDKVAEFRATARPGPPDTLTAQIPLAQPGSREQKVGNIPEVRVVDRFGNGVPDIPVAWQVIAGEGRVASPITISNGEGKASVEWTLGNRIGVHKLTASIERATGSPVTFTAHVFF